MLYMYWPIFFINNNGFLWSVHELFSLLTSVLSRLLSLCTTLDVLRLFHNTQTQTYHPHTCYISLSLSLLPRSLSLSLSHSPKSWLSLSLGSKIRTKQILSSCLKLIFFYSYIYNFFNKRSLNLTNSQHRVACL